MDQFTLINSKASPPPSPRQYMLLEKKSTWPKPRKITYTQDYASVNFKTVYWLQRKHRASLSRLTVACAEGGAPGSLGLGFRILIETLLRMP